MLRLIVVSHTLYKSITLFATISAILLLLVRFPVSPATASASSPTTLLIPIYNSQLGKWDPVIQAKTNHPDVPMVAIINPGGGPGSSPKAGYTTLTQRLHSVGINVVGYTWASYGSRNISDVFTAIDDYKSWYNVDGIFIDQMSYTGGDENYYSRLTAHARSTGLTVVIGNPGTETRPSYVRTVDAIVIHENSGLPSINYLGGWHANYDKANWGILPHDVNSLSKSYLASASKYVGYIYMSNGTMPNPWNSLPPYFGDMVAALDPAPSTTTTTSSTTTTTTTATTTSTSLTTTTASVTTTTTTSATATSSSSTTTTTSIGGTSHLSVGTQDTSGATLTGYNTVLSQNGVTVASGFTPATFTLNNGQSYSLLVNGFGSCSFDHWLDNGSTGNPRAVSVTSDTQLTAVMNCVTSTTTTSSTTTTTTSTTTTTTTPSPAVPSRPTGLSAKPVSPSEIDLTWTPPASDGGSPIIGYQIEISADSGTNWSVIAANTGSTATTYSSTGLSPLTTYTYRVSAINSVGTSDPSDTASATTYLLCVGICL